MEKSTIQERAVIKEPLRSSVLIGNMWNRLIVLLPIVLMLAFPPWANGNPGFVNATELIGRVVRTGSGAGIPDVTVRLLGPGNVGMDVTSTNKDGLYTIDLSVLEDKELVNLKSFFLQAEEKGKSKTRVKLGGGLKLDGSVIWVKDIKLP